MLSLYTLDTIRSALIELAESGADAITAGNVKIKKEKPERGEIARVTVIVEEESL